MQILRMIEFVLIISVSIYLCILTAFFFFFSNILHLIVQKLMEQDNIEDLLPFDDNSIMSSGGDEIDGEEHEDEEDMDVEEDEDDEMKAYTIIPPQQQSLPTSNIYSTASSASQLPLQSKQHQLPSISSLMTDHSSHILPPLRKRPNNNN
jgi:hypothetical protein